MRSYHPLVLLGPQRFTPMVDEALDSFVARGRPVAAITAGWEERETEDKELGAHVQRDVLNLELHRRLEDVRAQDAELLHALRAQRDELGALQLRHLGRAAEDLLRREGPAHLLEPERELALENVRALDGHRLERVDRIHAAFWSRWRPSERPAVLAHRRELAAMLHGAEALCIAGGNVEVLWNCLWLFEIGALLPRGMPIVAWSAGAMALAERIVLFHDNPPQGRGYAEVWGPGLGIARRVVPLPHAAKRLQLDDPVRVQLLSRRFPGAVCIALDEGARLVWDGRGWSGSVPTRQLTQAGTLTSVAEGP